MKEHPILFSGEMVRAILEGRKTQTRRPLTKQPLDILPMKIPNAWITLQTRDPNHGQHIRCRFGVPGDQLWVKERLFAAQGITFYQSDNSMVGDYRIWKWKNNKIPSIFMPHWASRITLEIVNIRVERVQEITPLDAVAEGISIDDIKGTETISSLHRMRFAYLWNSINAKRGYGWDVNPWVWVIEFKRIEVK